MNESHMPSRGIPPELSSEYDDYIELALEYADGKLPPDETAAFEERMRADATFRQAMQPLIETWRRPREMSREDIAARYEKLRRRLRLPPLEPAAPREVVERRPPVALVRDAAHADPGAAVERALAEIERKSRGWRRLGSAWRQWPLAASIVGVLAVVAGGTYGIMTAVEASHWVTTGVPGVETVLTLADSSVVQLERGAKLSYRKELTRTGHREAKLEGDARFDIVPHAGAVNFVVRTPALAIKAEQARFVVRAQPDYTEVWVESGNGWAQYLDASGDPIGAPDRYLPAGSHIRVRTADRSTSNATSISNRTSTPADPIPFR